MRMTPPPSGPVPAFLRYSESTSAITITFIRITPRFRESAARRVRHGGIGRQQVRPALNQRVARVGEVALCGQQFDDRAEALV